MFSKYIGEHGEAAGKKQLAISRNDATTQRKADTIFRSLRVIVLSSLCVVASPRETSHLARCVV